ncbi:MAG: TlpA family protein disulfide reductase [Acidobacteriia bacterium]|nr:TlpA family protein disulfide reductase [Terriglobia bacterium]
MKRFGNMFTGFALVVLSASAIPASAQSLEGRWDATVTVNGALIPFRLDISGSGSTLKGTLYNGEDKEYTTDASYQNGKLVLNMEHYLTRIAATLKDGELDGNIQMRGDKGPEGSAFHARRYTPAAAATSTAPSIAGLWVVPFESGKGEKAWRFIVKQSGADVSAAILRVDGDTGALTGTYRDGKFVLSHFDGSRPYLLEVTPQTDGSLALVQKGGGPRQGNLKAYRNDVAEAKGLPKPSDYTTHTTMKDANDVFAFSGPDVNGKVLSNDDSKFKGKVVLAIVTGTWCPNCHDEAQYLVQLYKKYHDQGLEIVALDFEEPEEQDDLSRVHAFIKQYGVQYTYLIEGAPAEMWEKVPQLVNLNTWPATVFVGRDGRVDHVHAGFAAPASREFNDQLKAEFTSTIERLLVAKPATLSAANGVHTPAQ